MREITVVDMFKSKIHFGHLRRFVSPKMREYIYTFNNKISIINLDLTLKLMARALNFMESIIKNKGVILFVGTKRQANKSIEKYAKEISMPYVNCRWLGGILTNYKIIRKSIKKIKDLEDGLQSNNFDHLTKKEKSIKIKKLKRLKINLNGIKDMSRLPNALFVIDVNYESTALLEAAKLSIPTIGIVDTNSNPDMVNYVIPGNDDSVNSIDFILNVICDHIKKLKFLQSKTVIK